jgi:hypothetical protein
MLPRCPMPALLPLLCAPLWMGCAPPVPVVVPPSLLACAPAPMVQDAPDDSAIARLLLDLAEAHEDCAGRLARVREIVAP